MKRFRIKYAKRDSLKYTSGLEVQKLWERSLRRAKLPVAYSQGYHPQARLNQAAPLPLGFTSTAEWVDIWFEDACSQDILTGVLPGAMPSGIQILELAEIELSTPTMQNNVISVEYKVTILQPVSPQDLEKKINAIQASDKIMRVRRQKEYDLRPLIEILSLQNHEDNLPEITMRLSARPGATGRPEEVLLAMDLDPFLSRIEKTDMFFSFGV